MHAVTSARPDITVVIDPKTVRQTGRNLGEDFSAADPLLSIHGECTNMMFTGHGMGAPRIDNVQLRFIRGKGDSIRLVKVFDLLAGRKEAQRIHKRLQIIKVA